MKSHGGPNLVRIFREKTSKARENLIVVSGRKRWIFLRDFGSPGRRWIFLCSPATRFGLLAGARQKAERHDDFTGTLYYTGNKVFVSPALRLLLVSARIRVNIQSTHSPPQILVTPALRPPIRGEGDDAGPIMRVLITAHGNPRACSLKHNSISAVRAPTPARSPSSMLPNLTRR